jgi:hypothetical protein
MGMQRHRTSYPMHIYGAERYGSITHQRLWISIVIIETKSAVPLVKKMLEGLGELMKEVKSNSSTCESMT